MRNTLAMILLLLTVNLWSKPDAQIYLTQDSTCVTIHELAEALQEFDVIFFGEYHDNAILHRLEIELLQELVTTTPSLVVSMEMFERDTQDVLDSFLDGRMEEKEFITLSRAWPNYPTDYKPIIDFSRQKGLPVIAANIPREYAAKVRHEGWKAVDSVPIAQRRFIARNLVVLDDAYKTKFFATMQANMGSRAMPGSEAMFGSLYRAQCLKDDTMAESIADYLSHHPGAKIIHYNGDFHSNSHLGTAQKLALLNPELKIGVITPVLVEPEAPLEFHPDFATQGDAVIVMHRTPTKAEAAAMFKEQSKPRKHQIKIELEPENHRIFGKDTITFSAPVAHPDTLYFLKEMEVHSVKANGEELSFTYEPEDDSYSLLIVKSQKPISSMTILYEGEIYQPLKGRSAQQHHDGTRGIISGADNEGIYLPPASWYPQLINDPLMDFEVYAAAPAAFTLITSGAVERHMQDGMSYASWKTEQPTDGLTLVGNRFTEHVRQIDGITLSTYLLDADDATAESILDSLAEYHATYSALFGPYPYSSFALVENFFASGFGMPGYTVIAPQLIQMPMILLSPGALAHEFVHGWWGNSVYVDYDKGNWCEALTVFSTNYYWHVLQHDAMKAQAWREDAQLAYNLLPEENRYPLRNFIYQRTDNDAVIGYDKGASLLIQIRRILGDEAFFDGIRNFYTSYKGREVGWDALLAEFQQGPHADAIGQLCHLWLDETTIPAITIDGFTPGEEDASFTISLHQTGSTFPLLVDMSYRYPGGVKRDSFFFSTADTTLSVRLPKPLTEITVDPAHYIMKKIETDNLPYMLSRTLADSTLCILPAKKEAKDRYLPFINYIINDNISLCSDKNYKKLNWKEKNLLVMGSYHSNGMIKKLARKLPDGFSLGKGEFTIHSATYSEPTAALLVSFAHPYAPGKMITLYLENSSDTPFSARRLLHYMHDSWIVLGGGMGHAPKGMLSPPDASPYVWTTEALKK